MIREIGVVVPAANEQRRLPACLTALTSAARRVKLRAERPIAVRIVVVLDRCTDGSAAVLAGFPGVESIAVNAGRVGVARAAGARRLLDGLRDPGELWLANTDADSTPPMDWLAAMVDEADRGNHVVLGCVLPEPEPELPVGTLGRWHARHMLRDGHPHVHGANFGIRADAYLAVGGWPALATGEDQALAARAEAAQLNIARTSRAPVPTSTRLSARAPYGFSSYLRGLAVAQPSSRSRGSNWLR